MADDRRPLESSRLAAIVEGSFPLPIAVAFAQMRLDAHAKDMQQLAGVLDAIVRHLATVTANDALAGHEIAAGRSALIDELDDFKKPLSTARWLEVLHLSLRALDQDLRTPIVPGLDDWFRDNAEELQKAVSMRERGRADYDELARIVLHLLATLTALPCTRLMWIDSSGRSNGTYIELVLWLDGVQSSKGKLALSEAVESDVVYFVAPGTRALLSLDPLYRVMRCPTCTEPHLFLLDERKRGEMRFTAVGLGHRLSVKDRRRRSVSGIVRGHRGRRVVERLSIPLQPAPPAFARGQVVGKRHRIQRTLREEGLGTFHAATDQATHRTIGLEVLPYQLLRAPAIIENLCREAQQARSISHPHLVPIIDEGIEGGDHYLAVELPSGWPIQGGRALDVSQLPRPVSAHTVLSIAKQTLQGLSYLHGRGLVHGDLKPSSLMLFNGGIVKIGDYAVARSRASILLNLTGRSADPKYSAPERTEDGELDPRSDLYSLGVMLDEMIGDAPRSLSAAIDRALEKDPARRHQSAPEFLEALEPGQKRADPSARTCAWLEIVESKDPGIRPGDRIAVPPDRVMSIGDERCTVAISGMPAAAAIIEWSERDRAFTIRHGGLSASIPISTTVDGHVLPPFKDAGPRRLRDHTAIVLQSFGGPLLSGTFRVDVRAPPPIPASSSFVKFRCKHCDASHLVARSKIRERAVRAHCKRCSKEIIIVVR